MRRIATFLTLVLSSLALCAQNLPDGVILPDKPNTEPYVDYSTKENGFWAGVDILNGTTLHIDKDYRTSVTSSVHAIAGYRFNSYAQIGLGLGVKIYGLQQDRIDPRHDGNIISVPFFFNARGVMMNPRSRVVLPCWSFDIGYAFFDGLYVSPTLGVRIGGLERHHFVAGVAYVLQGAEVARNNGTHAPGYLHSLQLKLGYQF